MSLKCNCCGSESVELDGANVVCLEDNCGASECLVLPDCEDEAAVSFDNRSMEFTHIDWMAL